MTRSGSRLLLAIPLAAGCWGSAQPVLKGRFDARWTGPDTGQVSAPGTAEWCSEGRLLEIRAIHGDTAIAMVLYPLDTVQADTYRVVPPRGADSLAPSAAVALRFFSPTAIKGYQGDSGSVVLRRSKSGELSGSVEARSRSVLNGELLTITGRFQDIVVVPQTRGCTAEAFYDSAETEPDFTDGDEVD